MDEIEASFFEAQATGATALSRASDLVDVTRLDVQRYVVRYRCRSFVRSDEGAIVAADDFSVGFWLHDGYLRQVVPSRVITWLAPETYWHPNIRPPFVCAGRIDPGTPLVELIHRVFDIITYGNVTMREDDALNRGACAWTRRNLHRIPTDDRPIKRRSMSWAEATAPFQEGAP